jgi:Fe-S oxidoreductase/nitrate reductase gamma subunit
MTPTREVYFNISGIWLMYAMLAVTLAIFAHGVYRRVILWRLGQPADRARPVSGRLRLLLQQVLSHRPLLRRYVGAGFSHFLLFWGFVFLFLATTVVFIHQDLKLPIMQGWFYLWFQSLAVDLFGALAVLGTLYLLWQRYVTKAPRLKPDRPSDGVILLLILVILVTGFVLEGLRIELTRDPWAAWSPVGYAVGLFLAAVLDAEAARSFHRYLWWFHCLLAFGFIAWIPYSKLFHLFTSPANIYLQNLCPKGELNFVDIEKSPALGVSRIEQFTWKDLFDLDACTECGRCEVNCPAFLSSKPLSPKHLILDLRDFLHREGPAQLAARQAGENRSDGGTAGAGDRSPLVGPVIQEDTLWSCTTCRACMEHCPVMIEQVPKIVEMRRHLVMEQAEFPEDLQGMVRSLEARGHPYPGTQASRTDWMKGLNVVNLAEKPEAQFDVLFWVGCAGAFNERQQRVTRAIAELLQKSDVKFAVLGREERCSGDPARRIGHEFLFQTLAQQTIATLNRFNVKTIVTACPHCLNSFLHDYPQLGAVYEVKHHTQFLRELLAAGKLALKPGAKENAVFHDPCYLGRYNDEYESPRAVLDAIPELSRKEAEWSGRNALCCGGGGGFSFMEEKLGTRMSHNRSRQLLATGARTIAVGCPFCMVMLEDGVKTIAPEQGPEVLDVAEILHRNVG